MAENPGMGTVLGRGLCLAFALLVSMTAAVRGQFAQVPAPTVQAAGDGDETSAEDTAPNVFLQADRRTLQKLADSHKLLAEGRFGEAVRFLGEILGEPEDFFFQPDRASPIHRSLKTEAQRLIGQMPRQGRELYELQYGARARQVLDRALESGDTALLAEVSRQFFHTRSGYRATFLLGLDHFDRGRPLAGALTLQRLQEVGPSAREMEPTLSLITAACWLRAGMSEKARDTLVALRHRDPMLRVTVGGRDIPIFANDAKAVDWLAGLIGPYATEGPAAADRWLMFRGDAARNATAAGGAPLLNARWRVPVTDDPLIEAVLEQSERHYSEPGVLTVPAMHPLAVDDVLLMRTLRTLLAVDFSTGKRLWEAPVEDIPESVAGGSANELRMRQSMMLTGVGQRMWSDMTYGALSSDGRRVFAIEDLDLWGASKVASRFGVARMAGIGIGRFGIDDEGEATSPCNRLAAYDIRTGKLRWNLGGPAGQHTLRQAETFFLGAPLPLMGQLYVLGEIKGEVRLMVLDGATGDLVWSQQLAVAEQGILQDPVRRWAGASPSYADGILVCPTSTGAMVAVELATRSLLWGYRYDQTDNKSSRRLSARAGLSSSRWSDSSVCIADGRVLVTPVESDSLHCLSLIDGRVLWKSPRQSDCYVACVDRGNVALVGRHAVRALRLSDGQPAWEGRTVGLPSDAVPCGRGFLADDCYYLPISSAEVIGIDLAVGKIVRAAKSRKGDIPGNLICHRGKVVSQGLNGVDAYCQLDLLRAETDRRLAADRDDAVALSLRGEILFDAGNRSEAVSSFRHAYTLAPAPRTRQLLREALLEGMRTEFAVYRDRGSEVEQLIDSPAQQASYLRLMADGLQRAGQWTPALDYYQQLIDLQPEQCPLDEVSKTRAARRDCWFRAHLASLRDVADEEAASKIDAFVRARLEAVLAANSIDPLQRFLDYHGDQPVAAAARDELVRRLTAAGRLLEAELEGPDAGLIPDAAAREDALRRQRELDARWPVGKIKIGSGSTVKSSHNAYNQFVIDIRGDAGPFLADVSLHFDGNRQTISCNDQWGREKWSVLLATDEDNQRFGYNRTQTHARVEGHLLLVSLPGKTIAIDASGSGKDNAARLLWSRDMLSAGIDPIGLNPLPLPVGNLPGMWWNQGIYQSGRQSLMGPVTNRHVCFQQFGCLVAADPYTGETLWVRQDVPSGSDVFGDERSIFVLSPDREEAVMLRATDGEQLGTCKVPRHSGRQVLPGGETRTVFSRLDDFCLARIGRRLLLWWPEGNRRTLTLVDPLEGRDVWPGREFSNNARTCVVGEHAVGVFEPSGRFVLVNLSDGQTVADVQLRPEPKLTDITVLANAGRYFLITRRRPTERNNQVHMQPLPGCDYEQIYRGRLYALDEQGKPLWPQSVLIENQFLLSDQPARLPLLSFACLKYEQKPNGQHQQKMSVLCIDKRNGRVAYQEDFVNQPGVLSLTGDIEKKTVDLVMHRKTVKLTFTDEPLPPEASAVDEPDEQPDRETNPIRSLWKSIQRAFGPLNGVETEEEERIIAPAN